MRPEEYIEKLKAAQCLIDSAKRDIDRAIYKMQQRIDTGNEKIETDSRERVLIGRAYLRLVDDQLYEAATAKID